MSKTRSAQSDPSPTVAVNVSGRPLHGTEGRIIEVGASFEVTGPVEQALVDDGHAVVPTEGPAIDPNQPPPSGGADNTAHSTSEGD